MMTSGSGRKTTLIGRQRCGCVTFADAAPLRTIQRGKRKGEVALDSLAQESVNHIMARGGSIEWVDPDEHGKSWTLTFDCPHGGT